MTANVIVRRITQKAMERNKLREYTLSSAIGCSKRSVDKLLNEEPVKLTQEQWFHLMNLGGVFEK